MPRPRIGITTSYKDGRQSVDTHYASAIEAAGGLPIIVPILETTEAATEFATMLDGLVMTGGPGITKGLVGSLPDDLEPVDPVRATSDERIYNAVGQRPILGICYGMQFINAQAGGTIYGDVQTQKAQALVHSSSRGGVNHTVRLEPDSHLHTAMNTHQIEVNTHHVQAILEVGTGLKAVAFGPDNVIEGIESGDGRLLGVQFHPELMIETTLPLFKDFVTRCQR